MKHCLSCHQDGHTYQECQSIPIESLLANTLGFPDLSGISREQLAENIAKADRHKKYLELKAEFDLPQN
jgi:hypothetical protein